MANGMANAQKGAPPRRCAHGANATPRDGVGFGNPIARCVARTGRGKRRRVGRELQLAEHLAEHLGLGGVEKGGAIAVEAIGHDILEWQKPLMRHSL